MNQDRTPLKEVMADVGYLILFWSRLEAELTNSILELRRHLDGNGGDGLPHFMSQKIAEWRTLAERTSDEQAVRLTAFADELEDALRLRNAICHGLVGATGDSAGTQAGVTVFFDEEEQEIGAATLRAQVDRVERARLEIKAETHACVMN